MYIALGVDHRGIARKQALVSVIEELGFKVLDLGAFEEDPTDDYSTYAAAVVDALKTEKASLGVLVCGSGEGMAMQANRVSGIRAAIVWHPEVAVTSRQHNDANVLVLPADFIDDATARECLTVFLQTAFLGEDRYVRRNLAMDAQTNIHTT